MSLRTLRAVCAVGALALVACGADDGSADTTEGADRAPVRLDGGADPDAAARDIGYSGAASDAEGEPQPRPPLDGGPGLDAGGPARDAAVMRDAGGPPVDALPPLAFDIGGATLDCAEAFEVAVDSQPLEGPIDLGRARPFGEAAEARLTVTNVCGGRVRFLGHPDDWVDAAAFSVDGLPPVYLEPGESTELGVRFAPPWAEGPHAGRLELPHDGPDSPLLVDLRAQVEPRPTLVFAGDGRHVVTTTDYGETVAHDDFETMVAHGDALQRGVCWGAGRFVAVGGNVDRRWWTSVDGVEWVAHRADGAPIADCAWANGRFFGSDGRPLYSEDGETWVRADGAWNPNHIRAVAAGDDRFLAAGDGGRVAISLDGEAWLFDQNLESGGFSSAAWGRTDDGGVFVAAGEAGWVAASADGGQSWVAQQIEGARRLAGAVFAGGQFVVGDGGTVWRSPDGLTWSAVNAAPAVPRVGIGRLLFGTSGNAFYRSEDAGFTWRLLYESPGGLPVGSAAMEGL